MKDSTLCAQVLSLILSLIFMGVLSGCTPAKNTAPTAPIVENNIVLEEVVGQLQEKNLRLEKHNKKLQVSLARQKELTAQLQLSLLEKHAELNKLIIKNERLVNEFVRNKVKLRNRGNKVETVRLHAEVTAIIDTAKTKDTDGKWVETIKLAEQYLTESQDELKIDNIDGAAYLASQALDIIQSTQLDKPDSDTNTTESEVVFFTNLPMKVITTCNVREAPSINAKVLFVQKSGTTLTATGYSGLWVKIKIKEGEHGWIHYSLLSSARQ